MKNSLLDFEEGEKDFFITRSPFTTTFEHDRKKDEFHIYFIKENSNPEAYEEGYKDLKVRKLNRMELAYFLKTRKKNYQVVFSNEDGSVYNFISNPFDKSQYFNDE